MFFLFPLYFLPTLTRSIQKGFINDFSTRKPVWQANLSAEVQDQYSHRGSAMRNVRRLTSLPRSRSEMPTSVASQGGRCSVPALSPTSNTVMKPLCHSWTFS